MAPEQAKGHSRNVAPAADVYSLGAILYEMLTGRPPFKGETPIETIRQVVDDDPVAPSQLVPRLPRDLETISLKCLSKEPARRYLSAQALADDLYRYLHGQVIHARRTPPWERTAKWSRRNKLAAASLAAGIAAFACLSSRRFRLPAPLAARRARQKHLVARSGESRQQTDRRAPARRTHAKISPARRSTLARSAKKSGMNRG